LVFVSLFCGTWKKRRGDKSGVRDSLCQRESMLPSINLSPAFRIIFLMFLPRHERAGRSTRQVRFFSYFEFSINIWEINLINFFFQNLVFWATYVLVEPYVAAWLTSRANRSDVTKFILTSLLALPEGSYSLVTSLILF
jgi:hypothetical protein